MIPLQTFNEALHVLELSVRADLSTDESLVATFDAMHKKFMETDQADLETAARLVTLAFRIVNRVGRKALPPEPPPSSSLGFKLTHLGTVNPEPGVQWRSAPQRDPD